MLSAARPEYGFLGEESGTFEGSDGGHTWIVDPLDGTTNFLFGSPLWGVNVALARNGRVVAGVTSLPMLDEFYVAELGGGAWCNEQRIHVSARGRLVEAVLACGIPFRSEEHTSELQSLMRISYALFCLKKKTTTTLQTNKTIHS